MTKELQPGLDYYYNQEGKMVLTADYLLRRGYCCGNGCLHCPYDYEQVKEPGRSKLLLKRKMINKATSKKS